MLQTGGCEQGKTTAIAFSSAGGVCRQVNSGVPPKGPFVGKVSSSESDWRLRSDGRPHRRRELLASKLERARLQVLQKAMGSFETRCSRLVAPVLRRSVQFARHLYWVLDLRSRRRSHEAKISRENVALPDSDCSLHRFNRYDMRFDARYPYYQFAEEVGRRLLSPTPR